MPQGYISAKAAAKRLGVGRELIEGLVAGKQIEGIEVEGKSGAKTIMVKSEALRDLEAKVRGAAT
ncbi:hypothetical protein O7626_00435 [Micromonospora sp. WMMD1102]|uniref:hypothetical protein n=1 Tax=Micromonospora sp. WMMD1102 TaxID=3016105 RepID=UPI0024151522|nr:hypothetical protein [Micromonospora sp. WMMD1102]MDG4784340.1 hypothetical protein [Micromonospora sp. WMMD1102]MDG4784413.1 hypothetical protein [Micromonospora sp. WMMD1102]